MLPPWETRKITLSKASQTNNEVRYLVNSFGGPMCVNSYDFGNSKSLIIMYQKLGFIIILISFRA